MKYLKAIVMLMCLSGAIVAMESEAPEEMAMETEICHVTKLLKPLQLEEDQSHFELLPDEVMLTIFAHLIDTPTIAEAIENIHTTARVNNRFRKLLSDQNFNQYVITTLAKRFPEVTKGMPWIAFLYLYASPSEVIRYRNQTQERALEIAIIMGHKKITKFLVEAGTNLNTKNEGGNAPLLTATRHNRADTVKLLLDHKADINIQDNKGETALIIATHYKYMDTIKLLLHYKADINIQDNKGETALIWAVLRKHTDLVRMLLEAGANPSLKDKKGKTALDWSQRLEDTQEITQLIKDHIQKQSEKRNGKE